MKSQLIKKFLPVVFIALISGIIGCKKDNGNNLNNVEQLPCTIAADKVLVDKGPGIDYIASCEVVITNGTLTINPGVTIAFETNAGLTVIDNGALKAIGTVGNPITLTGKNKAKGAWMGIFFQSNSVLNQLSYADVEYAGGKKQSSMDEITAVGVGTTDINTNFASRALITNTTIKESNGYGLSIDYNTYINGFSTNKLNNNTLAGLKIPMGYLGNLDAASDYLTGNAQNYIFVRIGDQGDYVTSNQTWKLLNAPYRFEKGTLNVYFGEIQADVTVEPGVTMLFNTNTGLMIGEGNAGSLNAKGTTAQPITFKGVNPGNGGWVGLSYTTNSVNNILQNCIIDGGGASNPPASNSDEKGNIVVGSLYNSAAKLTINTGVTVKNSASWGIYQDINTNASVSSDIVYQNNTGGNKNK